MSKVKAANSSHPSSGGKRKSERQDKAAGGEANAAERTQLERAGLQSEKRRHAAERIEALAVSVAEASGLEIVDVELLGSGRNQLLRIYIDKPSGVTHADCELVSHQMSAILDAEDPISGNYELEVSSPGVERKLKKWADWQRFTGQKVKVVLREPVDEMKSFDGTILQTSSTLEAPAPVGESSGDITLTLAGDRRITFPFSLVERANLKFEW